MKRFALVPLVAFALAACDDATTSPQEQGTPEPLAPQFSHGGNPHFVGQTRARLSGSDLSISFKEAGLGNNTQVFYVAKASVDALYACKNRGNNFPADPKKQQTQADVFASGDFSSGRNGQVKASIDIPAPASTLDCPGGQTSTLICISYSGPAIADVTDTPAGTAEERFNASTIVANATPSELGFRSRFADEFSECNGA